jgi:ribonuclease D
MSILSWGGANSTFSSRLFASQAARGHVTTDNLSPSAPRLPYVEWLMSCRRQEANQDNKSFMRIMRATSLSRAARQRQSGLGLMRATFLSRAARQRQSGFWAHLLGVILEWSMREELKTPHIIRCSHANSHAWACRYKLLSKPCSKQKTIRSSKSQSKKKQCSDALVSSRAQ